MNSKNNPEIKHFDNHKIKALNVLLKCTVIGGVIFALINYQDGQFALASMELIVSIVAFILLIYLKHHNNIVIFRRVALSFVLIFCIIMLYAFAQSDISVTVYIFALLIPLFSHLLLGTRVGLVVTAVLLALAYAIFFYYYHNNEVLRQPGAIANVMVVPLLIWALAYSYEQANENAKETLIRLASRDHLTDLYNRRMLNDVFQYKLKKSLNNKQPLSVLMADLDHFKKINDLYGHQVGDQFIKQFAEVLQLHSGTNSSCFRVGGEEFCVFLSNTDKKSCHAIAENIRHTTEQMILSSGETSVPVTVSIGIATCHNTPCQMSDLLELADKKLYQAKQQGRNQVVS